MAQNTIEFTYDRDHQLHVARPDWDIQTELDCKTWYGQYEAYFSKSSREPVDVVFVLDNFSVAPGILTIWGRYRAELVKKFTRFSFRVNSSRRVSTTAHTSGAIYSAASDEAPSLEVAIERVLEMRARNKPR